MARKPTRRAVLTAGAGILAGAAAAQVEKVPPKGAAPADSVEAQLARPLSAEAKRLLEGALKTVENARADRLKFKLPENSEPCTVYRAASVGKP